jgi:hypothetical protein
MHKVCMALTWSVHSVCCIIYLFNLFLSLYSLTIELKT